MAGETPSLFASLPDPASPPAPAAPVAPPDQAERRLIETDLDTTMLVEAAAGTGKTTSMIRRMLELIATGRCTVGTLAAVTFTRKATAELRARFQIKLEEAARRETGERRSRLEAALDQVEQCFIGTIHSFCGRLLRERPIEAGVDVAFEELDEDEEFRLRSGVWDEHIAELHAADDPILELLDDLGLELLDLREAWVRFAEYPDVANWPAEPIEPEPEVEARAATAVREMCRHMESLQAALDDLTDRDDLMELYRNLPRRVRLARLGRSRELIDVLEQCAAVGPGKIKVTKWPQGKPQGRAEREAWQAFLDEHANPLVRNRLLRRYEPALRVLHGARALYDRTRAQRGVLNYQDLLMRAADLLRDKPHIRRYFRQRFTHLLVDEFQDTDPVQAEVMLLLTAADLEQRDWALCRPAPGSLFVVGDPKQSIYRFRRADIVTYDCVRDIIRACGRIVPLTANFRSIEPIIEWVNGVSAGLFAHPSRHAPADSPMQSARPGPIEGDCVGVLAAPVPATVTKRGDIVAHEAMLVARTIRAALDDRLTLPRTPAELDEGRPPHVTPGDFLVLTWARQPLVTFAEELAACGIPVEVTGGTAVNDVDEVAQLHTVLAAVVAPDDPVALVGCLRGDLFGISDTELYRYAHDDGALGIASAGAARAMERHVAIADALTRLERYAGWVAAMQPVAAVDRIAGDLGLLARCVCGPGGPDRGGAVCKAIELLRSAQREHWTATALVDYLRQLVDPESPSMERHDGIPLRPHGGSAVRVMNLHQAKGLEAPVVFLVDGAGGRSTRSTMHVDRRGGAARGFLQLRGPARGQARTGPVIAMHPDWETFEQEEERFLDAENDRLLYVAATRAGTQLVVSRPDGARGDRRWDTLTGAIGNGLVLAEPPVPAPRDEPTVTLDGDAPAGFTTRLAARRAALRAPTYAVSAVKRLAVSGAMAEGTAGELGTEWGSALHQVLEAAMLSPTGDLEPIALSALEEQGLDPSLAGRAVDLVRAAMASTVWRRAQAGRSRLTEVPIQFLQLPPEAAAPATILRGVIDLVFREDTADAPAGWVIVDYKTDDTPGRSLDDLVDHYAGQVRAYAEAWSALVGEPVSEAGLLFVQTGVYRTVDLEPRGPRP